MGQCSMTVALPVLSACGLETCVLPTAILSTHTGGFWKPSVTHLDGMLEPVWKHWKESGIRFDGIYTGYLGSVEAIGAAETIMDQLLEPGGLVIVDPAMADNGRLYSGLDKRYAAHMKRLCARADVILPNLTEAAMLTEMPYEQAPEEGYVADLLETLPQKTVVLTGVGYREGETGAVVRDETGIRHYVHRKVGGSCSGTGDLFAAGFVGALMQGRDTFRAVKIAADFTEKSVENTRKAPAHWYGVAFEPVLPELIRALEE